MPRTLNDFSMQKVFPPSGKYHVSVTGIEKGKSAKKQTPQITVTFSDGEIEFDDNLFVTLKTIPRLALFAKRVCGMDKKTVLPDDDEQAATIIAKHIMANSVGKKCIVMIEESEEQYIAESGLDIGKTKTIKKRRVAYNGYYRDEAAPDHNGANGEDNLPF